MLTCVNLKQEWLEANNWDKRNNLIEKYLTTDRLQRLFAFNCAKSPEVYKQLTDPRSINCLEVIDKYLDDKATIEELIKARDEAWEAYYASSASARAASWAASAYASARAASWAASAYASAAYATSAWAASSARVTAPNQPEYQAEILVKLLRPEWEFSQNWITEVTKSLATRINDERRFDLSPILADALEDLGCDNVELLEYLRDSDELVKGDWVIDNLLGKR